MKYRIPDLLSLKASGGELSSDQINFIVQSIVDKSMADAQLGAFLSSVFHKGMVKDETIALTHSMMNSGSVFTWPNNWKVVDKHSTGGVGDKVSIPLTPALAACGVKVPMISGKGLGHTGGTLDKLESIPGYRIDLSEKEMHNILDKVGCCITGQTGDIVPADKKMYATRDVTSTVASLPLIVSSIISKKAAESPKALVLDVKFGCGSFNKTFETAESLAQSMVDIASGLGIKTTAILSTMNEPIGKTIGNSLEIIESIKCLRGEGPRDLELLVIELGAELLYNVNLASDLKEGQEKLREVLKNGAALDKFSQMIQQQGVSSEIAKELCGPTPNYNSLKKSKFVTTLKAEKSGYVKTQHALDLAEVSLHLGAGRSVPTDSVNHGVGIFLDKVEGDHVSKGETWISVHHDEEALPDHLLQRAKNALTVGDDPPDAYFWDKIRGKIYSS